MWQSCLCGVQLVLFGLVLLCEFPLTPGERLAAGVADLYPWDAASELQERSCVVEPYGAATVLSVVSNYSSREHRLGRKGDLGDH